MLDEVLQDSVSAARLLLGWRLIHETSEGVLSGLIVETEAYAPDDAASHSFRGKTERTKVMFGPAGYAYVYFTYGMHYCFNVVTGPENSGQAVLIRALEPEQGIERMKQRRGMADIQQLTNGPAKLVQALGITMDDYGKDLHTGSLRLEPGIQPKAIEQTTRVGIARDTHRPWRFYIADNPFVSQPHNKRSNDGNDYAKVKRKAKGA